MEGHKLGLYSGYRSNHHWLNGWFLCDLSHDWGHRETNRVCLRTTLGAAAVNKLRPRQNGRHFADDIFKCIFLNENVWITIKISLKFVPKGPINNIPALVQKMAWRRPGDKPLSETMMVRLLTHICVTRPQWVNVRTPKNISNRRGTLFCCALLVHDDVTPWTRFPCYYPSVRGIPSRRWILLTKGQWRGLRYFL